MFNNKLEDCRHVLDVQPRILLVIQSNEWRRQSGQTMSRSPCAFPWSVHVMIATYRCAVLKCCRRLRCRTAREAIFIVCTATGHAGQVAQTPCEVRPSIQSGVSRLHTVCEDPAYRLINHLTRMLYAAVDDRQTADFNDFNVDKHGPLQGDMCCRSKEIR